MKAQVKYYRKLWAVVTKDGLVRYDDQEAAVKPFLIFRYKVQAEAAVWKRGEKVIPIVVGIGKAKLPC